jgi:hypothetical protein
MINVVRQAVTPWATLLTILPNLILSPLAGRSFLMHSHDEHGLHGHALKSANAANHEEELFSIGGHTHDHEDADTGISKLNQNETRTVGSAPAGRVVFTLLGGTPFHARTATLSDRSGDGILHVLSTAATALALHVHTPISADVSFAVMSCEPMHNIFAPILRANHAILI